MVKLHFYKLVLSPFSAFNLNVFRFLYCTGFLLTMLYHRGFYFGDIPACIYNPLGVVRWINVGSPSEALFQNLFIISVIFLFLAALGVFARTSLLISSLSTLLFFAFFLSCGRPDQPTYLNPQHKIAIGTLFILA